MDTTAPLVATEFHGWPFLDPSLDDRRLLTAVACTRWYRGHGATTATREDLTGMLTPHRAVDVRRLDVDFDLPAGGLTARQHRQAEHTLTGIAGRHPGWAPLLKLPIRLRRLTGRASISASSFAVPQHVFLADAAFTTPQTLAEQLLHELCHQWLYLIEELTPLARSDCGHRITLPSGTSERGIPELLGALHVAVALRALWLRLPVDEHHRQTRLNLLDDYTAGCLNLLDDHRRCLTGDGRHLADRLNEEVHPA